MLKSDSKHGKIKTIAFYLPQFHETEENNKWWGKGFTEWTAVKKTKPLYPGHYQPREPLNDNYYDLTNPETLRWQAALARKYDIYGFCIYHYWFEGKQLLQKPAEILLENRDIDINYCFSWANESWVRTWSAVDGNNWNADEDEKIEKKGSSMLMEQTYGTKEDWEKHFYYLLPFFKDSRYIKRDGEPVVLLYKPRDIKCLHSMLKTWDGLAKENGFGGLYVVSTNDCEIQNPYIKANAIFEPAYSRQNLNKWQGIKTDYIYGERKNGRRIPLVFSYQYTWTKILNRKYPKMRKTFLGGFVKFDKTPREGRNAMIYIGASGRKFKKYFEQLIEKSRIVKNEFIFLNAWNEWGEGANLEPDKKYGYKYLEAIKTVNEVY